jgi:hypothetical protein
MLEYPLARLWVAYEAMGVFVVVSAAQPAGEPELEVYSLGRGNALEVVNGRATNWDLESYGPLAVA